MTPSQSRVFDLLLAYAVDQSPEDQRVIERAIGKVSAALKMSGEARVMGKAARRYLDLLLANELEKR